MTDIKKLTQRLIDHPTDFTAEQRAGVIALITAAASKSFKVAEVVRVKTGFFKGRIAWVSGDLPNGLKRVYFSVDEEPLAMYPEDLTEVDMGLSDD